MSHFYSCLHRSAALLAMAWCLNLNGQTVVSSDSALANSLLFGTSFNASGGSSANPRQFILGLAPGYSADAQFAFDTPTFESPFNELIVRNGIRLDSTNYNDLAFNAANCRIEVNGAGSEFDLDNGDDFTRMVIRSANNTIDVLDGATAVLSNLEFDLGAPNASLTINASGSGSFIDLTNTIDNSTVDGALEINVDDEARVEMRDPFLTRTGKAIVNVEDTGTFVIGGFLNIANNRLELNVAPGGTVEVTSSGSLDNFGPVTSGQTIFIESGGPGEGNELSGGTVDLLSNSDLTNSLPFTSGTLRVRGEVRNVPTLTSGMIVELTETGSFGDAATLNGGEIRAVDFDASNLTFTAGTLTVSGTLSNLNAIAAGQAVVIDGSSWSPTGSINDGSLTILNGGAVTVGNGFDGSNLTLTEGTLTVTGSVRNLPTIASGATVNLTSSGTLETATTLDGGTVNVTDFDLNGNLVFTSGTLLASGTVRNVTDLDAGQTLALDGASSALLLSQAFNLSGGTVLLSNGASVTVQDSVTFGTGALGFDSSGGTIALQGGTLNVASMPTPLAFNANASVTGYGTIFGEVDLEEGGTLAGDDVNGGLQLFGNLSGSGSVSNTTIFGNITIGNSPGSMAFSNVTFGNNSRIALEIDGEMAGEYDTLVIDAASDISNATLDITFSGDEPPVDATLPLVSGGIDPTRFGAILVPEGWQLNSDGTLTALPFEQWAATWGVDIGASGEDFDGDLLSNFLEYALGSDPTDPGDNAARPATDLLGSFVVFVHPARADDPSLIYTVEAASSLTLGDWTEDGVVLADIDVTGGSINYYTYQIAFPGSVVFVRLTISQ